MVVLPIVVLPALHVHFAAQEGTLRHVQMTYSKAFRKYVV